MVHVAAWIGIAVPLLISAGALIGTRLAAKRTLSEYLVCSKALQRRHFFLTLSASNAALANILFLFAYWGFTFGAWAWFWGAVFWGIGLLVFALIARRSAFEKLTDKERPELGLNEILGRSFGSKPVLVAAAIVSSLTFLFLLSLELNVGSKLFATFVPEQTVTTATPYAIALGFGLVLAVYAGIGGFPLVVRTDALQLVLVLAACVAIPLCVNGMLSDGQSAWSLWSASLRSDPPFALTWQYLPFVLGSLFSWGVWFVCTMDMWQRTLAIKSPKKNIGIWGILPGYCGLLIVSAVGVLVGLHVRSATGGGFEKFPVVKFVDLLAESAASSSALTVGLGVIMAGFVAAVLSTVDTYLVVVSHSLVGDTGMVKQGWLGDIAKDNELLAGQVRKRIQVCTILLPFLAVLFFWGSQAIVPQDNFTLYMIAGSIPMALVPACLALLWQTPTTQSREPTGVKAKPGWVAAFMLLAVVAGTVVNFWLANQALTTYRPLYFGLLYFVPAFVAAVAGLPFAGLLWRRAHG